MESDNIEVMQFDVVIVGAGPSGLASAIRLKQLADEQGKNLEVCVVEKASEVGAHILSGNVFETKALDELIPNWKDKAAPLNLQVKKDKFLFLTENSAFRLPTPPQMHNKGNYIISLANLCRWMATQAEELGVQIFPGFPASEVIFEGDVVKGIRTGAFGIAKDGSKKESYQAPMELRAKQTIFAEGCRGSLTKVLEQKYKLRDNVDPQTYAIGLKEIWRIDPEKHKAGEVVHTVGWPVDSKTYGGSFIYHAEDSQIFIGYVIGLDYKNTYLNPFKEFQRFKHHPKIQKLLEGGERISYGARALNEGGYQSIPQLSFPGGCLVGCTAGFLNVPKIKGSHTAIKSGKLAAEAVFLTINDNRTTPSEYEAAIQDSWIYEELYKARNIRPSFSKFGLWGGLVYSALDTYIFRGKAPWTFRHEKADHETTKPKKECQEIEYPKPDGKISFDLLSSVYLSGTYHEEDQPAHLKLLDPEKAISYNYAIYGSPETRYCPAGVYEVIDGEDGEKRFQINAQNCLHCKTCDIKDMSQNINWTTPEGGGGPNYPNM
jgi:electron-transferring-flavoprotein dehydrogenase